MATGKEELYIASRGNGRATISLTEVGEFAASEVTVPAATTSVRGTVLRTAAIVNLTDSSGGTSGGNTIAAIALPVASASAADTNTLPTAASTIASVTALRNAVATEAAKLNALLTALRASGVIT
jgi:hypothetical protein